VCPVILSRGWPIYDRVAIEVRDHSGCYTRYARAIPAGLTVVVTLESSSPHGSPGSLSSGCCSLQSTSCCLLLFTSCCSLP
jgi:hypothetical protein